MLAAVFAKHRRKEPRSDRRAEAVRVGLTNALRSPELAAGVSRGLVATAAAAAIGAVWRLRAGRPAPLAGPAVAGAFLLALSARGELERDLVTATALLAIAGLASFIHPLAAVVAAVPGAAMLVASIPAEQRPANAPLIVAIVAIGFLIGQFERTWGDSGLGPVLIALTVAGIYTTVPETRRALVLVGAALPLPLLGWPVPLASIGPVGWYAVPGLLMWTAQMDGSTRVGAVIGAAACFGLLLAEPLARAVRGATVLDRLGVEERPLVLVPVVALLHLGLVYVAARVAGLRADGVAAATIAVATLVISIAVLIAGGTAPRRRAPDPER